MRCYVDILLNTSTANIKTWERDNGLYGGLSPLARGTHKWCAKTKTFTRFIPAGAGNSFPHAGSACDFAVYPRWRGELSNLRSVCKSAAGLSPLARGTRGRSPAQSAPCRFIPAGAGNSKSQIFAKAWATVYPRWRGELIGVFSFDAGLYGLSPLARGTLRYARDRIRPRRFIPAGAGNSLNITYY